ncbi:MAG: hypothetical protein Q8R89_04870, partial [Desulfomicrobium sp.]|nr:hypothetical protein [Desulfomicrobium sp.]
ARATFPLSCRRHVHSGVKTTLCCNWNIFIHIKKSIAFLFACDYISVAVKVKGEPGEPRIPALAKSRTTKWSLE